MYITSNTEGADKTSERFAFHNIDEVQERCRMCDVNSDNLDNKKYEYNYLEFSEMHYIALHGTIEQRV